MHVVPDVGALDVVAPLVLSLVFVVLMSLVPEPARQRFNAILVAGAGSVYINGGLGPLEFVYLAGATAVAYAGLSRYPMIGVAWFMHTAWDVVHHFFGTPIWPWMPTSSAGCAVFDAVIGCWFLLGAPTPWRRSSVMVSG